MTIISSTFNLMKVSKLNHYFSNSSTKGNSKFVSKRIAHYIWVATKPDTHTIHLYVVCNPIYSADLVNAYKSKVVPNIRFVTSRFKTSTPKE